MAANTIANPGLLEDVERTLYEETPLKPTTLLERSEEILQKAFGDSEETIANSLRGL